MYNVSNIVVINRKLTIENILCHFIAYNHFYDRLRVGFISFTLLKLLVIENVGNKAKLNHFAFVCKY